jgi:hypothetical protein
MTEEFLELEGQGMPHVVFPNLFKLFEIFCPRVDILNAEQIDVSNNLLIGAIRQNLEDLFKLGSFPDGFQIPKETEVSVDFQYDQRQKLVSQTFDPTKVPVWRCPKYTFDPHWKEKLAHSRASEKEVMEHEQEIEKRRKFRIKKRNQA